MTMIAGANGIALRTACMMAIVLLSSSISIGQEPNNGLSSQTIGGASPLSARIYLAADPSIEGSDYEYSLNSEDKVFVAEFSSPMDRASTEAALKAAREHRPATEGIKFEWTSDTILHFQVPGSLRHFVTNLDGAKSIDGRVLSGKDENGIAKDRIKYSTQPDQIIQKIDRNGQILKELPIPDEAMELGSFRKDGKYAIAYRAQANEDGTEYFPYLLDLSGSTIRKIRMSNNLVNHVDDQWDPKGNNIVQYSPIMSVWSLDEILRGKAEPRHPMGVEGAVMNPQITVATYLSPRGNRCVRLQTYNTEKSHAQRKWPLEAIVVDRQGRLLGRVAIPLYTGSMEPNSWPAPRIIRWEDEDTFVIRAFSDGVAGKPELKTARMRVGNENVEIWPDDFHVPVLAPPSDGMLQDIIRRSGAIYLGEGEGYMWVLANQGNR